MQIPTDYSAFFQDRTIMIVGCSRSGTSILGKIIGSLANTYYLYEPAIMKYGEMAFENIRAILFEDYFLPIIQGRNLNTNKSEHSYWGNYYYGKDILKRQQILSSREKALEYVKTNKPYLVIKTNESQHQLQYYDIFRKIFNAKRIHIIRNGIDVVSSSIKKGWYTDKHLEIIVDYLVDGIPHYIEEDEFLKYDQITRCACVWRTLTEINNRYDYVIRYESIISDTTKFILENNLKMTPLTIKHLKSIRDHKKTKHENIINQIQQPERDKFIMLMNKLGYET